MALLHFQSRRLNLLKSVQIEEIQRSQEGQTQTLWAGA